MALTTETQPAPLFDRLKQVLDEDDSARSSLQDRECSKIAAKVPGWSRITHWVFWKALLDATPLRSLLMCGVYQGRDICLLLHARNLFHPGRALRIIGVDRFTDTDCDDWLETARGKSWEENKYGPPPSVQVAAQNIQAYLRNGDDVRLIQQDDAEYLAGASPEWDGIYLDSSHDYATVHRQIDQCRTLCRHAETLIMGDDFNDEGTFGVRRAVTEHFGSVATLAHLIWFTDAARYKVPITYPD